MAILGVLVFHSNILSGKNEVVETYALRQVSQNFLLDKNVKIVASDLRGEMLIFKLDERIPRNYYGLGRPYTMGFNNKSD